MTLKSRKEIDKIIALKEINHGKNGESRGLGHDIESEKSESERKNSVEK